jgi:hypothetical protein
MSGEEKNQTSEDAESCPPCGTSKARRYWRWIAAGILAASGYTGYSLVSETKQIAGHVETIDQRVDTIDQNVKELAAHRRCPPGCGRDRDDGRCRDASGALCN